MSGLDHYDQWKAANPPEYDYDCIEEAEKTIKEVKWAMMNWEKKCPDGWSGYIDRLIEHINELSEYISDNI